MSPTPSTAYMKDFVAKMNEGMRKSAQQAEAQRQHRQNRAHLAADQAPIRGAQPRLASWFGPFRT